MFSWEIPIDQSLIEWCNHMARQMRASEAHNRETGWFADNSLSEQCGAAAMAYETAAKHIQKEFKLREKIKE